MIKQPSVERVQRRPGMWAVIHVGMDPAVMMGNDYIQKFNALPERDRRGTRIRDRIQKGQAPAFMALQQ